IMAVLPGQLGIGLFSPRLDACGNSVRGVEACRELSRNFRMHMYHSSRQGRSVVRRVCNGLAASSQRQREAGEQALLARHAQQIVLMELQGDLVFSSAEVVVRRAIAEAGAADFVVLDFSRAHAADVPSIRLLTELLRELLKAGKRVVLSGVGQLPMLPRVLQREFKTEERKHMEVKPDSDHALEWCENTLIARYSKRWRSGRRVRLEACELLQGLGAAELRRLRGEAKAHAYPMGQIIIQAGDPSEELYFLVRGQASVWIRANPQTDRRVATFTPGMSFGEMALLDRAPRSAQVRADTEVECYTVPLDRLEALAAEFPAIESTLLRNLSKLLAQRLRKANQEIGTLNQ
ncbi:MAG: cyclic nucleotide-binding domain-containing protein, partial [Bdellovibrionaceae bacterium]|nr:cyclic nucleotide-binding domain-containing protein [Pseudobdellovibrionaceae bacterium]